MIGWSQDAGPKMETSLLLVLLLLILLASVAVSRTQLISSFGQHGVCTPEYRHAVSGWTLLQSASGPIVKAH